MRLAIFQSSRLLGGWVSFICKIGARLPFLNWGSTLDVNLDNFTHFCLQTGLWMKLTSKHYVVVNCFPDENWDDDQLLGFEPCNENLVSGCNLINGKCECDTIRTCNNPFEFPRKDMCLSALKRIEGEYSQALTSCNSEQWWYLSWKRQRRAYRDG